jgi:hypothetical protein
MQLIHFYIGGEGGLKLTKGKVALQQENHIAGFLLLFAMEMNMYSN